MVPRAPEEPTASGGGDPASGLPGDRDRRGTRRAEVISSPTAPPPLSSPPPAPPPPPGYGGARRPSRVVRRPDPDVGVARGSAAGPVGDDRPFLFTEGAPPRTRRDAGVWVMLAALGFLVGQIVALVGVEVVAALLGHSHNLAAISELAVPPEWYVLTSLVGLWVGFFGAPWLASRLRGTGHLVADLGLRFRWIDLTGILVGIGGQVLVAVLYAPFIKHLHNFSAPTQKLTGGSHGFGLVAIAVFTVVGAPFMEELFFRGVLLRGLVRVLAPGDVGRRRARLAAVGAAVVVDGLLFALAHAEWEQFAGLALFGMVLAIIAYRTGRLGMNMVAHASFNLVAVIAVLGTNGVIH